MTAPRSLTAAKTRELTDVITRLRRALRRSIRTDYPWESRPMAQVEVLQSLRENGASRVGDLAEQLRLSQSTVSALVGKLIDAGLVSRDVDRADRRASVVDLTSEGLRDVGEWDSAHQRRLAAALRSLDAADRAAVLAAVSALRRLVDALDDEPT
jgi:DNA-binding MarR family transcriptional regulator